MLFEVHLIKEKYIFWPIRYMQNKRPITYSKSRNYNLLGSSKYTEILQCLIKVHIKWGHKLSCRNVLDFNN